MKWSKPTAAAASVFNCSCAAAAAAVRSEYIDR